MRVEKPELNPMAKLAIGKLAEAGVVVSPEEVLWLQHLAERCNKLTGHRDPLEWVDLPTRVGNIDLWPLSLAAEIWLEECAYTWFRRNSFYILLSEAFAMAFGRKPEVIKAACDSKTTKKMLRAFASEIGASFKTLEANIAKVLNRPNTVDVGGPEPKPEVSALDWGDVVAYLCATCGGTPGQWLWDQSAEQVRSVFESAVERDRIQKGLSGPTDEKVRNILAFKLAVESIKNRSANG